MASVFPGSVWIGDIDFIGLDLSKLNGAFLMSLLEESQGVESDDERLKSVMRSFEAEINPDMSMAGLDSGVESGVLDCAYYEEDIQLCSAEDTDGQGFLEYMDNDPNFRWVDEEMVTSSPSDDMNWCIEAMENEMDSILAFEGLRDCYQICNEAIMEDHAYGCLWQ